MHVTFQIQAWDTKDMTRSVREHVVPTLKNLLFNDTDDFRGHTLRVLAP